VTSGADPMPAGHMARGDVGPLSLFLGFATIGALGFGGVMPWVRWLLVDKRRWCNEEEFLNLFALGNFLPGGNVVNVAVILGSRFAGLPGAVAALVGLVAPPALIVVAIGGLYTRFGDLPAIQSMIHALAAAAAGLIASVAIRMLLPLRRSPRALVVVAVVLVAVVGLRMPLIWMVCSILPASILAAHWIKR